MKQCETTFSANKGRLRKLRWPRYLIPQCTWSSSLIAYCHLFFSHYNLNLSPLITYGFQRTSFTFANDLLALCLLELSADTVANRLVPDQAGHNVRPNLESKLFDALIVFLKEFFDNVNFENNQQTTKMHKKLPSMHRVKDWFLLMGFCHLFRPVDHNQYLYKPIRSWWECLCEPSYQDLTIRSSFLEIWQASVFAALEWSKFNDGTVYRIHLGVKW